MSLGYKMKHGTSLAVQLKLHAPRPERSTWPKKANSCLSVHSLSRVRLFAAPWTAARQAFLPIINSQSLLKLMSIELVVPTNHLILCHLLLLLPSPPSFNLSQHQGLFQWVSSSHQVAKVLEFQHNISPSNEYSGLISFRMDWLDLLEVQRTWVFSNTTVQKHQFFGAQLSL